VFRSERYRDRPLVISGPGAGVDVTAMGVLGDILRIAAERR
jgi:homoserine dehydrogenase